jgi:hypothetical protein
MPFPGMQRTQKSKTKKPASIFSMILLAISGSPPDAAAAIRAAAALASILPSGSYKTIDI